MTPRPFAVCMQIVDVQHRLAEELLDALRFEREQAALDGADRCGRYVAVLRRQLGRVLADVLQHRAQILEVEQQEPRVVGNLEREVQNAFLRVVQLQQPGEQQRTQIGDRRSDRMPALAEHVPEHDGTGLVVKLDAERRRALASTLALLPPAAPSPERSPLTSAMKTGTPILENCSASVCSETVLPVPVAPVMRP